MKSKIAFNYKWILVYPAIFFILVLELTSCKKFLAAKPDKSLVTPTTIGDLQGLLDYFPFMNNQCSDASEIASDNYYLTDSNFLALQGDQMREAYLWQNGMFKGTNDWQLEYTVVYNANVVLDNINNIPRTSANSLAWDNCKGSALVFRAKSFFEIAQIWSKGYDSATADHDLGIPLRMTSDFNVKSTRPSLKETYDQIISDLKSAIPLLPDLPASSFRPSRCAAYGLLAETFLVMHDYTQAGLYADSCLQLNNNLLDYNTLDATSQYPFFSIQFNNPEVIMLSTAGNVNQDLSSYYADIDTVLLSEYDSNDLRKGIFFAENPDGSYYFKGDYVPQYGNFNGIATDEIYLIKAECLAREGKITPAMNELNSLLLKRWVTGTFIPYTAANENQALKLILSERRKELVYRMLRFSDIKRLNIEGANITLKRIINGETYTLNPNDPRYALPIPENVIEATGMQQN